VVYIFRYWRCGTELSFVGSFVVFVKGVKQARRFHVNNENTTSYENRFTSAGNAADGKISVMFEYNLEEKSTWIFGGIINVGHTQCVKLKNEHLYYMWIIQQPNIRTSTTTRSSTHSLFLERIIKCKTKQISLNFTGGLHIDSCIMVIRNNKHTFCPRDSNFPWWSTQWPQVFIILFTNIKHIISTIFRIFYISKINSIDHFFSCQI